MFGGGRVWLWAGMAVDMFGGNHKPHIKKTVMVYSKAKVAHQEKIFSINFLYKATHNNE